MTISTKHIIAHVVLVIFMTIILFVYIKYDRSRSSTFVVAPIQATSTVTTGIIPVDASKYVNPLNPLHPIHDFSILEDSLSSIRQKYHEPSSIYFMYLPTGDWIGYAESDFMRDIDTRDFMLPEIVPAHIYSDYSGKVVSLKSLSRIFTDLYYVEVMDRKKADDTFARLVGDSNDGDTPAPFVEIATRAFVSSRADMRGACSIVFVPNRPYILCGAFGGTHERRAGQFLQDISRVVYDYVSTH